MLAPEVAVAGYVPLQVFPEHLFSSLKRRGYSRRKNLPYLRLALGSLEELPKVLRIGKYWGIVV
jgi:hypothetical protein